MSHLIEEGVVEVDGSSTPPHPDGWWSEELFGHFHTHGHMKVCVCEGGEGRPCVTLFSPPGFPHWCCNHHLHTPFPFPPLQGLKLGSQRAVRRERHTSAMAAWRRNTAAQDALKETIAKVWGGTAEGDPR